MTLRVKLSLAPNAPVATHTPCSQCLLVSILENILLQDPPALRELTLPPSLAPFLTDPGTLKSCASPCSEAGQEILILVPVKDVSFTLLCCVGTVSLLKRGSQS